MKMQQQLINLKYRIILSELHEGKSLRQISHENGYCLSHMRNQLKKRYPKEYDELIHGKIIGEYKGNKLRKLSDRQTNRTECNITKKAKAILKERFSCTEEVAVWSNNFNTRQTIDLYSLKYKIGFELHWHGGKTCNQLIEKIKKYEECFGRTVLVLLKDSSTRKHNRSYIYTELKLKDAGIEVMILDITHPPSDTL